MVNNVRGYKTKQSMIQRIIAEENPIIIGLVETKLKGKEKPEIDGYEVVPVNRNEEGGGVLLAFKSYLKHMMVCAREYKEHDCEMLWMKLSNGKVKHKIGLIYMPQESRTSLDILKKIYAVIEEEAMEASSAMK